MGEGAELARRMRSLRNETALTPIEAVRSKYERSVFKSKVLSTQTVTDAKPQWSDLIHHYVVPLPPPGKASATLSVHIMISDSDPSLRSRTCGRREDLFVSLLTKHHPRCHSRTEAQPQ